MSDALVLWMLAGLAVGIVAGQLFFIAFDNYQSHKTRKEIAARNRQYDKERADQIERDRQLDSHNDLRHMPAFDLWKNHMKESMSNTSNHNKPDRLLGVMQDFFAELQERDKTNDKAS